MTSMISRARVFLSRNTRQVIARASGYEAIDPCYYLRSPLGRDSVVVDCGLGFNADFSMGIIDRYQCACYGFDPTRKHQEGLRRIAGTSNGLFRLYEYAIGAEGSSAIFYENPEEVSGSLYSDHPNVHGPSTVSYQVDCITLEAAFQLTGAPRVDLLKMDIEGAEYGVLQGTSDDLLAPIRQVIIEFHDSLRLNKSAGGRDDVLVRMQGLGFRWFTDDNHNYLFYH